MAMSPDQREEMLLGILTNFTRGGGLSNASALSLQNQASGGVAGGVSRATNVVNALTGTVGKGFGQSLEAAAGQLGKFLGPVGKTAAAFVELVGSMARFSNALVESQRHLSRWTAQSAAAYAQLDVGRMHREIQFARQTDNSREKLLQSQNIREQAWQDTGVEQWWTNVQNSIGTGFNDILTGLSDIVSEVSKGRDEARKAREDRLKLAVADLPLNQLAMDIGAGEFKRPALPPLP